MTFCFNNMLNMVAWKLTRKVRFPGSRRCKGFLAGMLENLALGRIN